MARFDGSLARTLDFGDAPAPATFTSVPAPTLRLATGAAIAPTGDRPPARAVPHAPLGRALPVPIPEDPRSKYDALARRRRRAQIKARRLLDRLDLDRA